MMTLNLRFCIRRSLMAVAIAGSSFGAHAVPPATVPALQVIAPNGAKSIVIESIHAPIQGLPQPSASIMDGATQYVVEGSVSDGSKPPQESLLDLINPAARAAVLRSFATTSGAAPSHLPDLPMAPWAQQLTREQLALFRERVCCNLQSPSLDPKQIGAIPDVGQFTQVLLAYNSAAAAASVAQRPCAPGGLLSRDDLLAQAAKARGLAPTVLESQAAVGAKRAAVPEQLYRDSVYRSLSAQGQHDITEVADAIARGDYDRVIQIGNRGFAPRDAAAFQEGMVTDRNLAWRPVLHGILDKGHAVVVMGAGHLGGPQGIIALLRADGYTVEPVTIPAAPSTPR
ncbi:hypothetical protein WT83_27465 [Burkholderia territorii]|uniref:TraB/GumN family protein n=1 Tax=Burkholderia territorii TaxID=1503055 RepID=A0A119VE43_9BURK|nr:TraB/GumN family protein [Burkholderia territorii]KWN06423.1 hypothetical protein WT83_27465 [Burkholderia territorii]